MKFIVAAKKLCKGRKIADTIASVRHGGRDGLCALHIAAAKGRTEICQYLIEELGFDPNMVSDHGTTPTTALIISSFNFLQLSFVVVLESAV
jgi:Ankyrin repeats (many copies)